MEKVVLVFTVFLSFLWANDLDKYCLNCHIKNRLPTELIYKRYLMKYSTDKNMKKAIFYYLKNPDPKNSIMPQEFFLKFAPKRTIDINDTKAQTLIEQFLKKYDIKKRLK